ncbi:glycosyltransferase [Lentzea sp. NPDC051213]|uniref:glycosyltransferase n=1 Tax=Lentzea sp. NPDC051213 TaxID=3364126 RepID=UPI0037BA51EE
MRLIFATMAAHGHTYPSVPLALAAQRMGHDVVFAAGEEFVPRLRAAGLNAVAAGMSLPAALAAVDLPHGPERVGRALGDVMTRRLADDLAPLGADLIVHDITTYGAALAGLRAGIPTVAHTFGRVDPGEMWQAAISVAASVGVVIGRTVDICPESLQAPGFLAAADRVPLRPVAWSPPGAGLGLPDGVSAGRGVPEIVSAGRGLPPDAVPARRDRPLVYLTLGTAFATADVLHRCITGLATLPVDVLVATGPAVEALGDVPPGVRVEPWVSQADLLPHVDLVVHHGGSGTTLGALAAARPQLVVPQGADGFGNADAVVAAGAGTRLLPDELTSESVADHARALLADEAVRAAARRVAGEIAAMPSPDEVISLLCS